MQLAYEPGRSRWNRDPARSGLTPPALALMPRCLDAFFSETTHPTRRLPGQARRRNASPYSSHRTRLFFADPGSSAFFCGLISPSLRNVPVTDYNAPRSGLWRNWYTRRT